MYSFVSSQWNKDGRIVRRTFEHIKVFSLLSTPHNWIPFKLVGLNHESTKERQLRICVQMFHLMASFSYSFRILFKTQVEEGWSEGEEETGFVILLLVFTTQTLYHWCGGRFRIFSTTRATKWYVYPGIGITPICHHNCNKLLVEVMPNPHGIQQRQQLSISTLRSLDHSLKMFIKRCGSFFITKTTDFVSFFFLLFKGNPLLWTHFILLHLYFPQFLLCVFPCGKLFCQ